MTLRIDRRSLILTGTLGLAVLAIPGFAQGSGLQAAQVGAPRLAPGNETGILKHLEMLGRPGEAHRKGLGERADAFFAECEIGEHAAPGGIGEGAEGGVESLFNHVVEY